MTIHELHAGELAAHPDNLRTEPAADLGSLTRSIKANGVVEPVVVVPLDGGGHRVVAGHPRLAAAVEAGRETVPCWVRRRSGPVTSTRVVITLVENLHPEDLKPNEQARGFTQLALLDITDTKAARLTGLSRTFVKAPGGG